MANRTRPSGLLIRAARPEDYPGIRDFLLENSPMYPGIELWWDKRVRPEFDLGRRVVFVVDAEGSLEGLFIGKPGDAAKVCTLRLRESVRNQGVGRTLITEGLRRLLNHTTSRFYVTISEAAEEGCLAFFESIGFRRIAVEADRYKRGLDEFVYSCPRSELVEIVRNELSHVIDRTLFGTKPVETPGEQVLVMSIRPEFAELIIQGRKRIEFRRRFSRRYAGSTVVFYITHPVQQFMFTATITEVKHGDKKSLWNTYEGDSGISQAAFDNYFSGTDHGYAIRLSDLKPLPSHLCLNHVRKICPQLRPPQSFQKLEPRSPLVRALDLPCHI